jgi:serine/threonine protein phosphatase 1
MRPGGVHIQPMLSRLFGSRRSEQRAFRAPEGARVYAVGDIHGRVDLLRRMHEMIVSDIRANGPARPVVVYLGDYVDRGDRSREVLDLLLHEPVREAERVHLRGNHEDFMLTFLADPGVGELWLRNGGDATLYSYGVGMPNTPDRDQRYRTMRDDLDGRLPRDHRAFLQTLPLYHVEGDYAFVHAGIRPGRALEDQVPDDALWIRSEFLDSRADHGCCVVHGHTITPEVEVKPNRIGIDTGAYYSGRLTCLVLDGENRTFLQT